MEILKSGSLKVEFPNARLWYIDEEHETFMPLCTWDEFIGNPEKYMHNMVEGK